MHIASKQLQRKKKRRFKLELPNSSLIFPMASTNLLVAVALISAIMVPALATEFIVGDENGWRTNFDYQTWAASKEFHVGDKLSKSYYLNVSHGIILSYIPFSSEI